MTKRLGSIMLALTVGLLGVVAWGQLAGQEPPEIAAPRAAEQKSEQSPSLVERLKAEWDRATKADAPTVAPPTPTLAAPLEPATSERPPLIQPTYPAKPGYRQRTAPELAAPPAPAYQRPRTEFQPYRGPTPSPAYRYGASSSGRSRETNQEADESIRRLQQKLIEQHRSSQELILLLESLKRELAQPTPAATPPKAAHSRKGEDGFRALYTMNRDGSDVKYLTAAPGMISSSSPEWSHDGTMLAFDGVPKVGVLSEAHLFVYGMEGPFKGMFKDLGCGNVPTWSPDDKRLAYMLNGGNPCDEKHGTWVMDSDGSNRKWLSRGWYPRFSPDGKQLHVWAYFENPASIHVIDPATGSTHVRKLLGRKMSVKFGGGTWSPDGRRLAFIGTQDGREHLATVAVDDSNEESVRILYTETDEDRELIGPPAWSPDGKQIVMAIEEPGQRTTSRRRWAHTHLYSLSAEIPSAPVLLDADKQGLVNRSPMWSPDSQRVVFSSER